MNMSALAMLGSAFMQIPAMLGTLAATGKAWKTQQEWSNKTDPARYQKSGWASGDSMRMPTRVNTGINDFVSQSYDVGKLFKGPKYAQMLSDKDGNETSYDGFFK